MTDDRNAKPREGSTNDKGESPSDGSRVDRRKFLQNIGAGAFTVPFGLGLASGTATAHENGDGLITEQASTENIREILDSPKVKVLLHELTTASLATTDVTGETFSAPKFDTEAARTVVAHVPGSSETLDSGAELTVTSIPSDMGTLVYGENEDGEGDAIFYLEEDAEYLKKSRDAPSGSGMSAIITDGTAPVFFREASEDEKEKLAKVVGANPSDIYASLNSKTNNFQVLEARARSASAQSQDVTAYQVNLDVTGGQVGTVVSTEQTGYCATQCALCGLAVAPCSACVSLCFTGIGTAACIICLIHTCGVNAPSCISCYNCLT